MSHLLRKIKDKLTNEKIIVSNISNLMLLEVTKYIFPLIIMPYLIRVLGLANYGVLVFSQTIANYFVMFTNYGFNLSGPRNIAINADNITKRNENASVIFIIKSILLVLSFIIILVLTKYVSMFFNNRAVFFVSMILVVNEVIFPRWFFQGMQEMDKITIITVVGRLLAVLVMFIIVKDENHLVRAAFIQVLGGLVSGVISLIMLNKRYKYRFKLIGIKKILKEFKEGWNLFISQLSTVLFTNINITFLGIFTTSEMVGIYSTGEKIVRLAVSLVNPISTGIFPSMSKRFTESPQLAVKKLRKFLILGIVIFSAVGLGLFIGANIISNLIVGYIDLNVIKVVRILSPLPLFVFVNNIYGTQYMINMGLYRQFRNIILMSGLILTVSSFVSIQIFGFWGAAISSFIGELSLVILAVYYVEIYKGRKNCGIFLRGDACE